MLYKETPMFRYATICLVLLAEPISAMPVNQQDNSLTRQLERVAAKVTAKPETARGIKSKLTHDDVTRVNVTEEAVTDLCWGWNCATGRRHCAQEPATCLEEENQVSRVHGCLTCARTGPQKGCYKQSGSGWRFSHMSDSDTQPKTTRLKYYPWAMMIWKNPNNHYHPDYYSSCEAPYYRHGRRGSSYGKKVPCAAWYEMKQGPSDYSDQAECEHAYKKVCCLEPSASAINSAAILKGYDGYVLLSSEFERKFLQAPDSPGGLIIRNHAFDGAAPASAKWKMTDAGDGRVFITSSNGMRLGVKARWKWGARADPKQPTDEGYRWWVRTAGMRDAKPSYVSTAPRVLITSSSDWKYIAQHAGRDLNLELGHSGLTLESGERAKPSKVSREQRWELVPISLDGPTCSPHQADIAASGAFPCCPGLKAKDNICKKECARKGESTSYEGGKLDCCDELQEDRSTLWGPKLCQEPTCTEDYKNPCDKKLPCCSDKSQKCGRMRDCHGGRDRHGYGCDDFRRHRHDRMHDHMHDRMHDHMHGLCKPQRKDADKDQKSVDIDDDDDDDDDHDDDDDDKDQKPVDVWWTKSPKVGGQKSVDIA